MGNAIQYPLTASGLELPCHLWLSGTLLVCSPAGRWLGLASPYDGALIVQEVAAFYAAAAL